VSRPARDATRLTAFVAAESDSVDFEALRAFAAERLPAYEVPGAIYFIESMPLTRNGKVDRACLEALLADAESPEGEPPDGPTEQRIAELWSALLEVPQVGRRQSFFDLGGDSLAATRLLEQVRKRFGVEVPMRTLFSNPTVEELARVVEQERAAKAEESVEGTI